MTLLTIISWACIFMVFLAVVPVISGLYQYMLVPASIFHAHFEGTSCYLPRVSILIPAWNEGSVIGATIDRLMALDYPRDRLRVYVVDDASNDATPEIAIAKSKEFKDQVFHIRRVSGGEGKAHTLNYGLSILWQSDWTQAVLIMDADVIYKRDALIKMARHLADPDVGAVTAFIKEGSAEPNYVQRYVTFEYITATGASRRAQNALGFLACLSGGAQLHSRENLQAIGGQIFSDTLAEDTFTTFLSQLSGRRTIFEPNAIVYAEEPDALLGLWKQRLRWARGNVQISKVFSGLWLNRSRHEGLGSISMSLLWFSIFLMPIFQIFGAIALNTLYFIDPPLAWALFRGLWIISGVVYLVVTACSIVIDRESAKKSWFEGCIFHGLISMGVIIHTLWPPLIPGIAEWAGIRLSGGGIMALTLFLYSWIALSMAVSFGAMWCEQRRYLRWLAPVLLTLGGYGSFLCAVTLGSYVKELRGAELVWDKTEKTGKVAA